MVEELSNLIEMLFRIAATLGFIKKCLVLFWVIQKRRNNNETGNMEQ
jgi:predicted house-cleaning noncanonical NTP pyrophosphatase (MazG superfamily)